jgi:type IV pilus assembly protein PilW
MLFTRRNRCSRNCADGFSLVELLVGLTVTSVIASAVLAVTLASRRTLDKDQQRNQVNQDLRLGLDLLGIDIRQAGERLPADFPAVEIIDGTGGAADTLIIRRNLLDEVLPLCEDVTSGTTTHEVRIAHAGGSMQGCDPVPDNNGDSWPDNLEEWRALRLARGGSVKAYIFNPVGHWGEFFIYDADGSTTEYIHKDDTGNWLNSYGASQQCRVYVIQERRYELNGDVLQLTIDDDSGTTQRLLHGVTDFQIQAVMSDGSVADALGVADEWSDLAALNVVLAAESEESGAPMEREASARFFPRNVLSL